MDSESRSRLYASNMLSKRLQAAVASGSSRQARRHEDQSSSSSSRDVNVRVLRDLMSGIEEDEDGSEEDASSAEFACPFCYEDFDVIGLCLHVEDEHPVEAKNGVCPVCASRVGLDLVGHITSQHGSFYKIQHRRRLGRGASSTHAMLSLLKRDLTEGRLRESTIQAILRDTSDTMPVSSVASDSLLSSLIYSIPEGDSPKGLESKSLEESTLINKASDEITPVARIEQYLSDKDLKEQVTRSKFVQELMLSTIFDDVL